MGGYMPPMWIELAKCPMWMRVKSRLTFFLFVFVLFKRIYLQYLGQNNYNEMKNKNYKGYKTRLDTDAIDKLSLHASSRNKKDKIG